MVLIHVLLRDCHAAWGFHQDKANTLVDSDKFLSLYTGRFKDLFPHNKMVRWCGYRQLPSHHSILTVLWYVSLTDRYLRAGTDSEVLVVSYKHMVNY